MADAAIQQKSYEFKIVLLGDRGVGKTCLVLRFIEGLYNSRSAPPPPPPSRVVPLPRGGRFF